MKVFPKMKMPFLYKSLLKGYLWLEEFLSRRVLYYLPKWFSQVHPKNLFDYRTRHFTANIRPRDSIADLGAGTGRLSRRMANVAKSVLAVDRSVPSKTSGELKNLEWLKLDVTHPDLPKMLKQRNVNTIVLSHILEHIESPVKFLRGFSFTETLLICVPSNENWKFQIRLMLGLNPLTDRTHFREYSIESLESELHEAGFNTIDVFYNSEGEIFGIFRSKEFGLDVNA